MQSISDAKHSFAQFFIFFFPVCSYTFLVFVSFLLGLLGEDTSLPAPQNISILSTNMKHFLMWSPVIVQGETVRYSVEFQG